ncbi:PqqD family protein [Pontixanthobacter sp.]|uniref:PqqD family protein n=1 Tax=Pontixanthobacter sp. TaxID=2792078 RepID=UPI003C7B4649
MIYTKCSEKFIETELDGELVVMNTDTGKFHTLKTTGLAIWRLIDGARDTHAIKSALMDEYDIHDENRCDAEISTFLQSMVTADMISGA